MMRVAFAAFLLCSTSATAQQATSSPTVQGQLRSVAGLPAPDGAYGAIFSIWDAAEGGNKLWEEVHTGDDALIVVNSAFSLTLGSVTQLPASTLESADLWLQVAITPDPALPRRKLSAVPRATFADRLACSGCVTKQHLDPAVTAILDDVADTVKASDLLLYAKKTDLPDLSPYAKTADLPDAIDLSPYAKTADLPDPPDLSPYLKTSDAVSTVTASAIDLAAGSTVSSRPISTRLEAVQPQVAQGAFLELAHGLGTNSLSVTGWYKDGDGNWVVAGTGAAQVPSCSDCGDGSDGAFSATSDTTLAGGTYNFSTFTIASGVTVTVTGSTPLFIKVKQPVSIAGTLTLSGSNGPDSIAYQGSTYTGGAGGGGGGGKGGDSYYAGQPGQSGAGPGGGVGGDNGNGAGGGGGGGGHGTPGGKGGDNTYDSTGKGAAGGGVYNDDFATAFSGGSGGGGGGYGTGNNSAGGTGGGGGGAVKITAPCIVVTGEIVSNGGDGGTSNYEGVGGAGDGAGAGGGSGGAIWLRAANVQLGSGIQATGGAGGTTVNGPTSYRGGDGGAGGAGRIRVDAATVTGSTNPPYSNGSGPTATNTNSVSIIQTDNNTVRMVNLSGAATDLRLVVIH